MTTAALFAALIQYGPTIVPMLAKLYADIEAGRGNKLVTAADLAELSQLANQTGEDIYKRLGITPPPPAP